MKRLALLLLCLPPLLSTPSASAQEAKRRPMVIEDLFKFKRVSEPQISPDGKWVVYGVGVVDLKENKSLSNFWLAATDGKTPPRELTQSKKSVHHPRWSPDGKAILYSSDDQLWLIDVAVNEPKKITTISTGASGAIWSRDGKQIAFVSSVWPEYSAKPFAESDALNKKRIDEQEKDPVKVRVADRLFYRHWDAYVEGKREHLFVMTLTPLPKGEGMALKPGEPKDVTPGDRDANPTSTTFSSGEDFTFSPDGKYLYFTGVPLKDEAWSTNYDIYRVPVEGGKSENVTKDNEAADSGPQFSPDGKWLAYRAQKKAGFEADRWQLMVMPADGSGMPKSLTAKFDGSVDEFLWKNDWIWFGAEKDTSRSLFGAIVDTWAGSRGIRSTYFGVSINGEKDIFWINRRFGSTHNLSVAQSVRNGHINTAFIQVAMDRPAEVWATIAESDRPGAKFKPPSPYNGINISKANKALLAELDLPRPESVTVKGADGTPVQMWILKPPGFDASKKWPLAFLVHGGPQGAWDDGWSYRWNAQLWAAQGYVVALPNPRGSTGFGQKFVDEISQDWGGKCYVDLMKCLEHMEKQPWIDTTRMAAAGGSFGGYMVNWFAVNNDKFKCLISHCGVWNFESMYATTEEIWFDEWEHGGPPWGKNRKSYDKHSPHKFAANLAKFKTPMLVIHNDLDFRVPIGEGIQLFSSLQRQGVPSRFVNFPDEGHWVLKPRNSQRWYQEVFAWMKKYAPPGGR